MHVDLGRDFIDTPSESCDVGSCCLVSLACPCVNVQSGIDAQLVVVILNREKLISEEKANGRHNQSH